MFQMKKRLPKNVKAEIEKRVEAEVVVKKRVHPEQNFSKRDNCEL